MLRAEDLLYPAGLREVVAKLDHLYAKEAESTRFQTIDEAFEGEARRTDETNVKCAMWVQAAME